MRVTAGGGVGYGLPASPAVVLVVVVHVASCALISRSVEPCAHVQCVSVCAVCVYRCGGGGGGGGGAAAASGKAAAAALEGIARNPGAQQKIFVPMILALALIESLVILAFVVANALVGKV